MTSNCLTKRSSSLPQLMSTASLLQKQDVSDKLCRMTLRLKDIKGKGIRKIMADREDDQFVRLMCEQTQGRR